MPDDAKSGSVDRPKSPLMKSTIRPLQSLYNALKSLPLQLFNHSIFRTTTRKPHTKTSFESLPNEILLEIFSHLELKPYIISHGVCKKWRQLLPSTELHPIRQRLLNLYRRILDTPGFERTQEWSTQNLQPFDREDYIRCLLQQYPLIPEEFRIWTLEWPARLLIQSTWPGLPFLDCRIPTSIVRRPGVNWIAYRPFSPRISSLGYRYHDPSQTFVPALLIWRYATVTTFLIFGNEGPGLFGQVMCTLAGYHAVGHIPYYPRRTTTRADSDNEDDDDDTDDDESDDTDDTDDSESVISEGEQYLELHDDWICYLDTLWSTTIRLIQYPLPPYDGHDFPISQPVRCRFNSFDPASLPAPTWDSSQRISLIG